MKTNISHFIDGLRNEQSNYIIGMIVICCLLILLISSIVMNGYAITSLILTSRQEMQKVTDLHISAKPDNAIMSIASASRWDFFGSSAISSGSAPGNYSLLGVEFSVDDPAHAKAIISTNSGEGEFYGIGDKLGPGVIVDRIDKNDVILLHNGVRQELSLNWEGESDMQTAPLTQPRSESLPVLGPGIPARYQLILEHLRGLHGRPGGGYP